MISWLEAGATFQRPTCAMLCNTREFFKMCKEYITLHPKKTSLGFRTAEMVGHGHEVCADGKDTKVRIHDRALAPF